MLLPALTMEGTYRDPARQCRPLAITSGHWTSLQKYNILWLLQLSVQASSLSYGYPGIVLFASVCIHTLPTVFKSTGVEGSTAPFATK